jgi:transcriptional regulator with XRE-family HTH domain
MGKRKPGDAVRILRQYRGLSQRALAVRTGIVQASVSAIESGRESLGARRAERIAAALDVRPEDLLWPENMKVTAWARGAAGSGGSRKPLKSSKKRMMCSGGGRRLANAFSRASSSPTSRGARSTLGRIPQDLAEVLMAFEKERVRYLVVGGYAVIVHTKPRYTKDLDLWIFPSSTNRLRAYRAILRFGAPSDIAELVRDTTDGTVWIGKVPCRIDFMLCARIKGVQFAEAWRHRQKRSIGGASAWFIGAKELIANKKAVGRPQDRIDARRLERVQAAKKVR